MREPERRVGPKTRRWSSTYAPNFERRTKYVGGRRAYDDVRHSLARKMVPVSTELLWDLIPLKQRYYAHARCASLIDGRACNMELEGELLLKVTKKGKLRVIGFPKPCHNENHLYARQRDYEAAE